MSNGVYGGVPFLAYGDNFALSSSRANASADLAVRQALMYVRTVTIGRVRVIFRRSISPRTTRTRVTSVADSDVQMESVTGTAMEDPGLRRYLNSAMLRQFSDRYVKSTGQNQVRPELYTPYFELCSLANIPIIHLFISQELFSDCNNSLRFF